MKNRIRALLKAIGKTQAELAAAVGMTPSAVSRHCDGETAPEPGTTERIARFLGVEVEALGLRERRRTGPKSLAGRIDRDVVEKALERLGLTAAELARKVGITRQSVSAFLTGRSMPRSGTLRKMAQVLRLEAGKLVTLEGE
ncbi:MAG: helix-turn-helix transcriptional regulator [Candidatus Riflebacteria bacterium]|nr:helix-turn-helix transcriptional regulator [Candidatus Riflebacteria bacterium]